MSPAGSHELAAHYESLESGWSTVDRTGDYSKLVVPNGNGSEPLHNWFHLKEAFSAQLIDRLIKDAGACVGDELSVLDPFLGGGTSLISAATLAQESGSRVRLVGVERNPFLWMVANAKCQAVVQGETLAERILRCMSAVEEFYLRTNGQAFGTPPSTTLSDPRYYPKEYLHAILKTRAAILEATSGTVRDILLTCLAAAIEPAGRLRRDGRALRYEPEKVIRHPWNIFTEGTSRVVEEVRRLEPLSGTIRTILGDGRRPDLAAQGQSFDWIVFSPPYPNNIDYTEVYKTEAWALGLLENEENMKALRLSTVRSHPSVRFPDIYTYTKRPDRELVEEILAPLLAVVPRNRYANGRRQVIQGYADDMLSTFESARRLIETNGRLVFIVGNSAHGQGAERFIIAADLILCGLAELAGWEVEEIRIARRPGRRREDNPFLRESVVILRPRLESTHRSHLRNK